MSLIISRVFTYDEDAGSYIQAVEAADGQALEGATRQAINNFVIGCKQDGIWTAIKASCILAGARTLSGALVPLVGTAPTNINFVAADYTRKSGLKGNGSNKILNANRANNIDDQNSKHLGVYQTAACTVTSGYPQMMGCQTADGLNSSQLMMVGSDPSVLYFHINAGDYPSLATKNVLGFHGVSRFSNSQVLIRSGGISSTKSSTSKTPTNYATAVFGSARSSSGSFNDYTSARLAFYSMGSHLDPALLDARVTALITALGVAIP